MFMDDDDEFGELYSDILPPQTVSFPNNNPNLAAVAASSTDPNSRLSSVAASSIDPVPDIPCVPALSSNHKLNLSSVNERISAQTPNSKICSGDALDDLIHGEPNEDWVPDNWDDDETLEENSNVQSERREKIEIPVAIQGEDWDSDDDSEDDLKIVLNDHPVVGVEIHEVENEDNLMAYDNNESNQDGNQDINDGDLERNEDSLENTVGLDGSKANEAARSGVTNFGQQQSMFKYVRPGATVVDASGQIRPVGQTVGPVSGHGRAEWRSGFGPKSFGSGWVNNSSRPFGGGLDFTLPSYKTIFDLDIEVFEEKRWRHPGVDISDYFNFGLNEESWKIYARQVDQLRIESTMQSKIRVHESDRSKQEYDPDLPPELAAAAGNHDISANLLNSARIDNGQSDLIGRGRGSPYKVPVGRPIQVETGNGERMPSAETRLARPRDLDVIIEVFPGDHFVDDATAHDNESELADKDLQGEKCNGVDDADYDRRSDSEYDSHSPRYFRGSGRENFNDRHGDNDSFSTYRGRSTDRPSCRRHESANEDDKDYQKETRENCMAANNSSSQSLAKTVSDKREPSTELADDAEDKLALDDSIMEDEGTSDSITRSSKVHKLSSRVEPANRDDVNGEGDDLGNLPNETSLQDRRWRNGNMRRYTNEHVRECRHEMMDRKRISSRVYETMPYPNRVREQPYPVRPVRDPERPRESDAFWRDRKTMVSERNYKDDGFKTRERSSRVRERNDEDYHRKEKDEKGENDRCRRQNDRKVEDQYHSPRHKDNSNREREVEDKHRPRHSYDGHRSKRAVEKDDNQFVDKRQKKENEDYRTHEKWSNNKEKSSMVHNSRQSDLDKISKETHKEGTGKNKDLGTQYSSSHSKRKHDDSTKDSKASSQYLSSHSKRKHEDNANREKVSSKPIDGQQKQEKDTHRREDESETNRESKRGRSKVERWSSDIKEVDIPTNDDIVTATNVPTEPVGNSDASHPDGHLDLETLEKLKRRRERFKTPLTSEKDTSSSKKLNENDLRLNQNETHTKENEIKHERPPRKRRWTSN